MHFVICYRETRNLFVGFTFLEFQQFSHNPISYL